MHYFPVCIVVVVAVAINRSYGRADQDRGSQKCGGLTLHSHVIVPTKITTPMAASLSGQTAGRGTWFFLEKGKHQGERVHTPITILVACYFKMRKNHKQGNTFHLKQSFSTAGTHTNTGMGSGVQWYVQHPWIPSVWQWNCNAMLQIVVGGSVDRAPVCWFHTLEKAQSQAFYCHHTCLISHPTCQWHNRQWSA